MRPARHTEQGFKGCRKKVCCVNNNSNTARQEASSSSLAGGLDRLGAEPKARKRCGKNQPSSGTGEASGLIGQPWHFLCLDKSTR
jgi:hypothetical protein